MRINLFFVHFFRSFFRYLFSFIFLSSLLTMTHIAIAQPSPEIIHEFAPNGILRVGINLGNPLLASFDASTQSFHGISVDLAYQLANTLGLKSEFTSFKTAGNTVEAVKKGDVDLVFVAIDPIRGADVDYSPAYVQIEGAYMVRNDSPLQKNEDVDQAGIDVVVGKGSAYDLFLSREIKHANLVRAVSSQAVVDDFMNQNSDVAAGVKQQLEVDSKRYSNLRLLPGRFMVINQAMGIPKGRNHAGAYLKDFIEAMKSSGFIQDSLIRNGVDGAKVAE